MPMTYKWKRSQRTWTRRLMQIILVVLLTLMFHTFLIHDHTLDSRSRIVKAVDMFDDHIDIDGTFDDALGEDEGNIGVNTNYTMPMRPTLGVNTHNMKLIEQVSDIRQHQVVGNSMVKDNNSKDFINVNAESYLFKTVEDIHRFESTLDRETNLFELAKKRHIVNCSSIHEIKISHYLGRGVFKSAFAGTFRGIPVAVKVVRRGGNATSHCIRRIFGALGNGSISAIKEALYKTHCNDTATEQGTEQMIHEIIHHSVLLFPQIVRHLGFCVRLNDLQHGEVTRETNDTLTRGIISVFEYGTPLTRMSFLKRPWQERIKHCRDVANLLELSEHSLLGPILYSDFKIRHLILVGGHIKLIDLDNFVSGLEPKCVSRDLVWPMEFDHWSSRDIDDGNAVCKFGIACKKGVCNGANALTNIHVFNGRMFLEVLTNSTMPTQLYEHVHKYLRRLLKYRTTATDVKSFFNGVLVKYAT